MTTPQREAEEAVSEMVLLEGFPSPTHLSRETKLWRIAVRQQQKLQAYQGAVERIRAYTNPPENFAIKIINEELEAIQ